MPQEGSVDIGIELEAMGFQSPVPEMARRIVEIDPAAKETIIKILGSRAATGYQRVSDGLQDERIVDNIAAETALYRIAVLSGVAIEHN